MDLSQDIFDCIRALSLLHNVQSFYFVIFVLFPLFYESALFRVLLSVEEREKVGQSRLIKIPRNWGITGW